MINREKVIKGLECCAEPGYNCEECPYRDSGDEEYFESECVTKLSADALAMLEAQEPRVLTLEEVMNSDAPVVVDYYDMPLCYASFERDVSSKKWARFYTFGEEDFIKLLIDDYNKRNTWRCWSARPTDEQREAVKWDE